MSRKQKLELTWIGKENRPKLEPWILLEDPEKSYHAKHRATKNDIFDDRLIFGSDLLGCVRYISISEHRSARLCLSYADLLVGVAWNAPSTARAHIFLGSGNRMKLSGTADSL